MRRGREALTWGMQYRIGKVLLWIGILAWLPYAILKYGLGHEVHVAPFLTAHLCGVIPGSILTRMARRRPRLQKD